MASYKNTAITPGTDAEVAAQVAKIDANLTPTPGVIPVAGLSTPTPSPAKVVSPVPATSGVNLSQNLVQTATQNDAQYTQDLADRQKAAEAGKTASFDALLKNMLGTEGQTALTANEYANTGVDSTSAELKTINNQLIAEQRALDNEIRAIKENTAGVYGGAQEQMIASATDKSLTRQADLAVIQMAKQGQYDSAKTIADRAVAVKMERQKNINEALKLSYEENKDLFTTAEKRQFETAQKDRERKLEFETYKEKARYDQIIKQSDPKYQAELANTYSQIAARQSQAGSTLNGKPQTATQSQVQGYADRTNQSDVIITKIGNLFTGKASLVGQALPNIFKSSERQQYEQAQRNFVNAVLRRESGAVISNEEFANAKIQYFPQPGDTLAVLKQKQQNRETTINNLYQQSNVNRGALPGQIIEGEDGKRYEVEDDGITLKEI